MMKSWSDLPLDIISLIGKRLPAVDDFLRLSCVCKPWRSVAIQKSEPFPPWLMLAKPENDEIDTTLVGDRKEIRGCVSLCNDKVFDLRLPQLQGRRCWGTQFGWLFTLGRDGNIFLLNPLAPKSHISLPPLSTFTEYSSFYLEDYVDTVFMCQICITKVCISSNPSQSSTTSTPLVMVAYGGQDRLAFASPGDEAWTPLKEDSTALRDVIFFKDHFYSVTARGVLRICDIKAGESKDVAPRPAGVSTLCFFYLADISGDLHLIVRSYVDDDAYCNPVTKEFQVYRFDFHNTKWIHVDNICKYALFLGNNTTFAISTSDHPDFKPDSIYFTDDSFEAYQSYFGCDMGVYDLKRKTLLDTFFQCQGKDMLSNFSRPFFFMPALLPVEYSTS